MVLAEEGVVGGMAVGEQRGVDLDAVFWHGIGGLARGVDIVDVDEAGFHFGWGVEPDGLEVEGIGVGEGEVWNVGGAPGDGEGWPGVWLGCIDGSEEERAEKRRGEAGPLVGRPREEFGEAGGT